MEVVSIEEYKKALYQPAANSRKIAFVRDIQSRLEKLTPYCEQQPYNKQKPES
ncbi:hypothetical protein [Psychrosphaera algicola]|uniref:Uncharacterized protein n=2 Tax=Psychrosphaera TaxID=907197 RepID=A0ABT5FI47_9GAMM|nr:hypothetical protein [Psychrosphaera sp. G1-22]MDC2890853.1 hypothetical protein [Psychrosphaera sp. G1-22]